MYMALPEPTSLSLHDALPILHSFHEPGDEVVDELFRGDRGGPLTGRVLLLLGHPGVDRALDEADRALGPQLRCRDLVRSEEHTSELQSRFDLVCRLLLEKQNAGT